MSLTLDPFTLLYNRLVKEFVDANFRMVNWNSTGSPQPDVATTGDLDELQLRPTSMSTRLGARSCASEVQKDFSLTINTGSLVLGKYLFPREWEVFKVVRNLRMGGLDDLRFNERRFVERVEAIAMTSGITDPTTNRKIRGWASIWTIQVFMSFSEQDMQL